MVEIGKNRLQLKEGYWREHIEKNIKRDKIVNHTLKNDGYIVLRFWDNQINKTLSLCITAIKNALETG
jgi:DNA mismatch endonuclease (patch repair protein)